LAFADFDIFCSWKALFFLWIISAHHLVLWGLDQRDFDG
jgi:hypothetical protein